MRDRLDYNLKLKNKYVCDRCGKTCDSHRNDHKILDREHIIPIYTDSNFSRLDLCEKCQEEFATWWNKKRKQRIEGFKLYDEVRYEDWIATTPKDKLVKYRAARIFRDYLGVGIITKMEDLEPEVITAVYKRAEQEIEWELNPN